METDSECVERPQRVDVVSISVACDRLGTNNSPGNLHLKHCVFLKLPSSEQMFFNYSQNFSFFSYTFVGSVAAHRENIKVG